MSFKAVIWGALFSTFPDVAVGDIGSCSVDTGKTEQEMGLQVGHPVRGQGYGFDLNRTVG